MKAITKAEVAIALNNREFPDFVIRAFNELIAESLKYEDIIIYQDDVVDRIVKFGNCSRQHVFDSKWLDIEKFYQNAGWAVTYNKPHYSENWKSYFNFN